MERLLLSQCGVRHAVWSPEDGRTTIIDNSRYSRIAVALAGLIPNVGLREVTYVAEPRRPDSTEVVGQLTETAYYFGALPAGRGSLQLYFSGSDKPIAIPLDLGEQAFARRDVSAKELLQP